MARALNKNKKPETKNKNRACNYFLGSFGSPCSFYPPHPPASCRSELAREEPEDVVGYLDVRVIVRDHREQARSYSVLHHPPTKC
ncbi:hypothetical protein CRX42_24375 [Pseudomonas jessenii]|uniref:Uncharacterized protein n=1 Tax=Pseudomonas jessenii TaxID=77298 RepID=A0A2W0EIK9_PSEJE|nr:hypothetical protein CRX42_24375 [Pseudomonas jessenii]